jgi:hypothetical protein
LQYTCTGQPDRPAFALSDSPCCTRYEQGAIASRSQSEDLQGLIDMSQTRQCRRWTYSQGQGIAVGKPYRSKSGTCVETWHRLACKDSAPMHQIPISYDCDGLQIENLGTSRNQYPRARSLDVSPKSQHIAAPQPLIRLESIQLPSPHIDTNQLQ